MFSKSNDKNMTVNNMNKTSPRPANSVPSIIGSDVTITGDITTLGEMQLDGAVVGDVRCASLTIGEQGTVEGIVTAEEVIVKGAVKGQINGRNIRLEKTAKVNGDLFHETLSIEAGAFIEGKLTHKKNATQDKPGISKVADSKTAESKLSGQKTA